MKERGNTMLKNQTGFTILEILEGLALVGFVIAVSYLIRHCNWFSF
jgi:hypothetical protein